MEKEAKNMESVEKQDFTKEYLEIIDSSKTSVVIESEWSKEGDYFQKLSMYDNNYTLIPTLGGTTLISTL
jgi:hypothetical protein